MVPSPWSVSSFRMVDSALSIHEPWRAACRVPEAGWSGAWGLANPNWVVLYVCLVALDLNASSCVRFPNAAAYYSP